MKTFVGPGEMVTVAAPANVSSGAGVKVGQLFGVAVHDALSTATLVIATRGVFRLPKVAPGAIGDGELVYWTGTACTATAEGNLLIGTALVAAASAATVVQVRLNGMAEKQVPVPPPPPP